MSSASNTSFDLDVIANHLGNAKTSDGKILIKEYVDGYTELNKLIGNFGTVFGFVTSDIDSKLKILQEHLKGENAAKYETVQGMIDYEVEKDITVSKTKLASGSRTLLRLHRALKFIIMLLRKLTEIESNANVGPHASEIYQKSLAEFHGWVIRKMVSVAFMTMSTKSWMLQKISSMPEDQCIKKLEEVVGITQPIYDTIQDLYTEKNLHGLP